MFFYLLMQSNHIETLHRKVCMRIDEDYYVENVYTLIRVPNNSLASQEFASRYFCLQSDSTHDVFIVWKRRNRVKRVDQRTLFEPEKVQSKRSLKISTSQTCLIRPLISKSKLIKALLIRPSKTSSLQSMNRTSREQFNDSKSKNKIIKRVLEVNSKIIPVIKQNSKFMNKPLPAQIKFHKSCTKLKSDTRRSRLFKMIKNKLKSFKFQVHKSKSSIRSLSRKPTVNQALQSSCDVLAIENSISGPAELSQYSKNETISPEFVVNKPKKLLSSLINRFSNRMLTKTFLIRNSSESPPVERRLKSVFKNIHQSIVKFITVKSDKK